MPLTVLLSPTLEGTPQVRISSPFRPSSDETAHGRGDETAQSCFLVLCTRSPSGAAAPTLRSRHEAHLARFGHGHCFILIRSRPCALPLSQRGVAETRHCFALNSSLIPGSFSAGLRRTTRKHSLATPMSDFFCFARGAVEWSIVFPFYPVCSPNSSPSCPHRRRSSARPHHFIPPPLQRFLTARSTLGSE